MLLLVVSIGLCAASVALWAMKEKIRELEYKVEFLEEYHKGE